MKCSLLFFAVTHTSRDHDVLGKFHLLHYQVPFVNVLLLANGPNMIILMVNRRVEVKVFFISKKTFFANFTCRRWISFLQHSWRFCLTDSEMIWAGTRRKADSWRSRFTIRWMDDRWMFSCSAIFLVLLLVPGWFLANKSVHQLVRSSLAYKPIWVDLRLVFWWEMIPFHRRVYK